MEYSLALPAPSINTPWTSVPSGAPAADRVRDGAGGQGGSVVRGRARLNEVIVEAWRLPAGHALPLLVRRGEVLLAFALCGVGERVGEDSAALLAPTVVGVFARPGPATLIWQSDAEVVTLRLSRARLQGLASRRRLEPTRVSASNGLVPLTPDLQRRVVALAEALWPGPSHGLGNAERVRAQLEASVVELLLGAAPALKLLQTPRAMRQAVSIVRERAKAEAIVDLPALAAAAGVTIRTLREGFRDCYGMSLAAFIQQARLEKARDALASGYDSRPMAEIARAAGFGSPAAFSRAYARSFTETPSVTRGTAVRQATAEASPGPSRLSNSA